MKVIQVGVDPGMSGGIVRIRDRKILSYHPMPSTELGILNLMKAISKSPSVACIEEIQSIYGVGKTSMMKLFGNYCSLKMALLAVELPFVEVRPKAWQKEIGILRKPQEVTNTWKKRLLRKAQTLYPSSQLWTTKSMTFQLSVSDAVLLAHCVPFCFKGINDDN